MIDGKLRNMASIYLLWEDQILLLYRQGSSIVSNLWIGSAGGHFEEAELNDAKRCVLRELKEELKLTEQEIQDLQLRYVTLRCADGEIRQNYYFFARLDAPSPLTSTEGIARWFPLSEIGSLPMPFTARFVIDHYLQQGKYDKLLYGGIADGEKVIFHPM